MHCAGNNSFLPETVRTFAFGGSRFKAAVGLALLIAEFGFSAMASTRDSLCGEQGRMFEIRLSALGHYANPVQDVAVSCVFTDKTGKTVTIPGFWNGGNSYRIRYAFQIPGSYSYSVGCNNPLDSGLNGKTGTVTIVPTTKPENPFLSKGRPVVSGDGRYLTYGNGEPFFYLAATCWEITWKSTLDQVRRFVSNQKLKKFNAAHLVVLNHQ
jgi:hypothetical protein